MNILFELFLVLLFEINVLGSSNDDHPKKTGKNFINNSKNPKGNNQRCLRFVDVIFENEVCVYIAKTNIHSIRTAHYLNCLRVQSWVRVSHESGTHIDIKWNACRHNVRWECTVKCSTTTTTTGWHWSQFAVTFLKSNTQID